MKKTLKPTKSVYSNKQNTLPRSNHLLGGGTMVSAFQRIHNWEEHIHSMVCLCGDAVLELLRHVFSNVVGTGVCQGPEFSTKHITIQSPVHPSPVICLAYRCLFIEHFTFTKNMACLALISRLLICIWNSNLFLAEIWGESQELNNIRTICNNWKLK